MKIAFLLYPTTSVKIQEDSSFWIMHELKRRGHEVFYFESHDLEWSKRAPRARLTPAKLDVRKGYLPSVKREGLTSLTGLDCIFIRKEPPFDTQYLYALQLLETIKHKVFVLNDPAGIAMANEKLFALLFTKYAPETLVTENIASARSFIKSLRKKVVVKPLHQKGGLGIFATSFNDENLPSLLETVTEHEKRRIMIQRFVPARIYGDKRIVILNGDILGAFIRKPPRGDFRANLSVGGTMRKASVNSWDKKLVEEMAPPLLSHGLFFVGIDVIGRYLTEVNVTSPAGIPELNHLNKTHLEQSVADFIEERCRRS